MLPIPYKELKYGDVIYTPSGHRLIVAYFGVGFGSSGGYVLLKAENDTLGGIQVEAAEFDKIGFLYEV